MLFVHEGCMWEPTLLQIDNSIQRVDNMSKIFLEKLVVCVWPVKVCVNKRPIK